MATQKSKILYVLKILWEKSDEAHPITTPMLIDELAQYDIQAERKSLYDDIHALQSFGIDIVKCAQRPYGYFVASREFEVAELKLLVDAVQSSRVLTEKKSRALIKKLSTLTSTDLAKELKRQVFIIGRPKSMNETVYYSVDTIHEAINQGKCISFRYFDYDTQKQKVYRREGGQYIQSPIALCWSDDCYYLIAYSARQNDLVHYRVDRMSDVAVHDEAAEPSGLAFDLAEYSKRMFGMYGGEWVKVKLRFDNSLIGPVLDRFGKELAIARDQDSFEFSAELAASPIFLGWIFQFGDLAEILEPQYLRGEMKQMAKNIAKMY